MSAFTFNDNWYYWGHKLTVESDKRKILRALDIIEGRLPKFPPVGDWLAYRGRLRYYNDPKVVQKRMIMELLRAEQRGEDTSIYPPRFRKTKYAPEIV